ncbi:hypothetical protein [Anaerovibrio sp. RM50]|uniref:hypothetical protein n=1 Tax=Anaerovibrio sp. RM50 TaxID=1200557 RepID=UPI000484BC33|nr:hypothetical protein [Anaerovibrio sp. RM50]
MSKLSITNDWKPLPYLSGTVENDTLVPIELSHNNDFGVVIPPKSRFKFDDVQLNIRSCGKPVSVRVVPFQESTYTANAEQIGECVEEADENNTASQDDIDALFE